VPTTTSRARRGSSEKPRRRAHAGDRPEHPAQPPLDAQPGAVRLVGFPASERARHEHVPWNVARPRLPERAGERKQHRARGERNHRAPATHDVPAPVHDEGVRRQECFDVLEEQETLAAVLDAARGGRVQDEDRGVDLRRQRGDARLSGGAAGPGEAARAACPEAPDRDAGDDELVNGLQRGGSAAGRGRRASARPRRGGRSDEPPTSRYPAYAALTGRRAASVAAPRRAFSGQPRSRDASAISASDTTHRARATTLSAEGAPRAAGALRASEVPELRHRDPRSARAGASSRSATRFNAPRDHPPRGLRAAVIRSP
jgi:hypothetical protein